MQRASLGSNVTKLAAFTSTSAIGTRSGLARSSRAEATTWTRFTFAPGVVAGLVVTACSDAAFVDNVVFAIFLDETVAKVAVINVNLGCAGATFGLLIIGRVRLTTAPRGAATLAPSTW